MKGPARADSDSGNSPLVRRSEGSIGSPGNLNGDEETARIQVVVARLVDDADETPAFSDLGG